MMKMVIYTAGFKTKSINRQMHLLVGVNSHLAQHCGIHSYVYSQCGDNTTLLGGGLHRMNTTVRAERSPDGINGHMSVIKVSLQVGRH